MNLFIERTRETLSSEPGIASDVLRSLKINPETVLILKNGSLVTEDEPLAETDDIKLLSVISGG